MLSFLLKAQIALTMLHYTVSNTHVGHDFVKIKSVKESTKVTRYNFART